MIDYDVIGSRAIVLNVRTMPLDSPYIQLFTSIY